MGYEILQGDALTRLREMPDESVQMCVTSPPYYGLRDYGMDGQIGLEDTPQAFVASLVAVFEEVRRVLKKDGTCWVNLGDSYAAHRGGTAMPAETLAGGVSGQGGKVAKRGRESAYLPHRNAASFGLKHKDLMGIPWRVAFALQEAGWWLRQDIIWSKPNPMPESVTDRCTKAHEYLFLLSKSAKYFYDVDAIREPHTSFDATARRTDLHNKGTKYEARADLNDGERSRLDYFHPDGRNKRSVWVVNPKPYSEAHFATFPEKLIEPCILAGSKEGDTVLDPFNGAGTTGLVSLKHRRNYIGIELNPEYIEIAEKRLRDVQVKLF